MNNLSSSKRGIIRRGIGLGGGLFLLVGLILNVQAESVKVHTYRPVFVKETITYSYPNPHPPFSPKVDPSLESLAAQLALEDEGGVFCDRCHERAFIIQPDSHGVNVFLDTWRSSADPVQ